MMMIKLSYRFGQRMSMQGAKGEPVIAGQAQHGPFEQMDIKRASLRLEFGAKPLSVKKVEVQEALPPAGVIGAEPLTLMPQHSPQTSVALFAGIGGQFKAFRQAGSSLRLEFGAKLRPSNGFLRQGAFSLPVRRGQSLFPQSLMGPLCQKISPPYALPGRVPRRVWRC